MSAVISIGCQLGGPDTCAISELKVELYRILEKHVTSTYCQDIDEYALVLRVDGSLDKFGAEGLARLRFAKAHRYITLDIQIPETVWKPMNKAQTKLYLAKQIRFAINTCVERLVKDKCVVEERRLKEQIDAALNEYINAQNSSYAF
jgi:hypothetical protein